MALRLRKSVAALCAIFLVGGLFPLFAQADEVDDAQASLDTAQAQLESITAEYNDLKAESDALQSRIDDTSAQTLTAQQAVLEGRTALGKSAAYDYRTGGNATSLVSLLVDAQSIGDLLQNLTYLQSIMDFQADQVQQQQQRVAEFHQLIENLNNQKNQQDVLVVDMQAKQDEANKVVAQAAANLQDAKEEQAARLAELQRMAEQMAAQEAAQAEIAASANTIGRQDVISSGPVVDIPADTSNATGWSTGVASAYGGSSDPYTPNPGTTATGALCDDYSMGVAVPMAWPNYRSYFGRIVEISYGGQTVFAVVNDCGGMGNGSRSLDLQPGVVKAFGFSDCYAWGLRTVSYRFL